MKKTVSTIVILLLVLIPALGNSSYLIRLKNGRQLATSAYWFEGRLIFFSIPGGTAGMERNAIAGVEGYDTEDRLNTLPGNRGEVKKDLPPASAPSGKPPEQPLPSKTKEPEAKLDLKAYKDTKDRMTVEVEGLLEKMREAAGRRDNSTKEKIKEEMRAKSKQIYQLTDEVKKKNNGKLPEGW